MLDEVLIKMLEVSHKVIIQRKRGDIISFPVEFTFIHIVERCSVFIKEPYCVTGKLQCKFFTK